jgi:GNAT superfamily N-acetyltransferase
VITIRPYAPADRPALYELLAQLWPDEPREALDRRWWWSTGTPPIVVAQEEDGALVGLCASLPLPLWSDGRERDGAWIVDFFVLPSHRGRGIGKRLVGEVAGRHELLASLSQTDMAWATFRGLGWQPRSFAPLYLSPWARVAGGPGQWLRRRNARIETTLGPAEFGPEFGELWRSLRDTLAPLSFRNEGALRARFAGGGRNYSLIRATVGGTLRAYMVVRELPPRSIRSFPNHGIALVADYLSDPEDPALFKEMIDHATRWARARGVRFVLCMSTHAAHQRVLRRRGFLGPDTPLVGRRLGKLAVGFTASAGAPARRPWHLTPVDCDLDLLFDAR